MGDKLVWAVKNGSLEEVKAIVEVSKKSPPVFTRVITHSNLTV